MDKYDLRPMDRKIILCFFRLLDIDYTANSSNIDGY